MSDNPIVKATITQVTLGDKVEQTEITLNSTSSFSYIIIVGTQAHRGDANFSSIKGIINNVRDVGEGSKLMFVHQALRKMNLNKEISYEFLICEDSYTETQLNTIKETVDVLFKGIFVKVKNSADITAYINTGETLNSNNASSFKKTSTKRLNKPIRRLLFYGHGVVGELTLGLGLATGSVYDITKNQVKNFQKESFTDDAFIYSYACRTGLGNSKVSSSIYINEKGSKTDPNNRYNLLSNESLAKKMANETGAKVFAFLCRSDYEETLFTKDELYFSDHMKVNKGELKSVGKASSNNATYKHLLNKGYKPTEAEENRWKEWKKIESNMIKVSGAWFDPDGARHNVKGGSTPIGTPQDMQTYKPQ